MYSPYGSYSSMSAVAQPMDIAPSSFLSRSPTYHASCAFPSWPQRSSLAESEREERATSYLSDEDLFPVDMTDDAHSISSASSTASVSPRLNDEEYQEMQRNHMVLQRQALNFLLSEKEKRKQAFKKQRRSSSGGSKKSPKSKPTAMDCITESAE